MSDTKPPDTIYLQWESLNEIWLAVRTDPGDVEYIRADVHRSLIADLLAACKYALDAMSGPDGPPVTTAEKMAMDRLRVVITKTEGKEEKDA